jgi:hypothetical protein
LKIKFKGLTQPYEMSNSVKNADKEMEIKLSEYLPNNLVIKSKSQLINFLNKNPSDIFENEEVINKLIGEIDILIIYLVKVF